MDKHLTSPGPRPGFALIPAKAGIQGLPPIAIKQSDKRAGPRLAPRWRTWKSGRNDYFTDSRRIIFRRTATRVLLGVRRCYSAILDGAGDTSMPVGHSDWRLNARDTDEYRRS